MKEIKLYSVKELTDLLQVTQRTVYNYIKSGKISARKMGKYWRIPHEEVERFIKSLDSNTPTGEN